MRGVGGLLPGRLRRRPAQDERSAADLINATPEREFPYEHQPAGGPDTNAFRRLGATFTPHPAARTAPINVIAAAAPAEPAEVTVLRKVADGLRALDWATLDAARGQEGATYAVTRRVRGRVPVCDAVRGSTRKPDGTPGLAPAAARHLAGLGYPPCDGSATFREYAALMRRVSELTGTRGTDLWPLPAIAAGTAS